MMGLFYAVPLQVAHAIKNHQADYPLSTSYLLTYTYMVNFKQHLYFPGGKVEMLKLKAELSSTGTGLNWEKGINQYNQ